MFRSGTATAPDPLRPGLLPPLCQVAKVLHLSVALPAAMHGIPRLAGIGVNEDGFARGPRQLADEAAHQLGRGAVDTDPDYLGLLIEQCCARVQGLSMGEVGSSRLVVSQEPASAVMVVGFAIGGIIALIDEATGYQEIRDRKALQQIVDY